MRLTAWGSWPVLTANLIKCGTSQPEVTRFRVGSKIFMLTGQSDPSKGIIAGKPTAPRAQTPMDNMAHGRLFGHKFCEESVKRSDRARNRCTQEQISPCDLLGFP